MRPISAMIPAACSGLIRSAACCFSTRSAIHLHTSTVGLLTAESTSALVDGGSTDGRARSLRPLSMSW